MVAEVLKTVGQIAGIGGLALGVFLLLFRDIIRRNIFPKLPAEQAFRLLRLITVAVWSVAIVGIAAWFFASRPFGGNAQADCGIAIGGDVSGSSVTSTADCDDKKPRT